jgi:dCMP deaminase
MTERISRDELFIQIARLMSLRGTCRRGQVGALIVSIDHRIIGSGYNGTLIGQKHCELLNCDLTKKCEHSVHAEANAIAFAARKGINVEGSSLYCTTAPCKTCAMLIVQAGIMRVVYELPYTTDNGGGLVLLEENGITINQHE